MSCPRCKLMDRVRAGKPHPEGDPPPHAEGCPKYVAPRAPGEDGPLTARARRQLAAVGITNPDAVPPVEPTPNDCAVCHRGEQLDEVPVGLATLLLCDDHAEQALKAYATSSLRSVIPERHQPARDVPTALRSFDASSGMGAFMYGPVGTGKSWAAAAMLKRLWLTYYRQTGTAPSMLWVNSATVFADLKAAMNAPKGRQRPDPMAAARAVRVLVLDDLGAERPTAWTAEHLYVLLNERYERMRPTVVTSNYDLGQLVGRMTPSDDEGSTRGEQIVSRLAGMTLQVPFSGDDRRVPT